MGGKVGGTEVKIKLAFRDWQRRCAPIGDVDYCRLSLGDFHVGTTFDAEITLDAEQEAELREAIEAGYQPVWWGELP